MLGVTHNNSQNPSELTGNKRSLTTGKSACCKEDTGPPNLLDSDELFVLYLQNFTLRPGTTAKNLVKNTHY
jgi:hypothetical protein